MGLITSSSYLAVFTSGTIVGASVMYMLSRFTRKSNTTLEKIINMETIPLEERFDFPELKDEYRLVMAIRNDLKMQKGKVAAQCGHASVAAYRKAMETDVKLLASWLQFGGTKITVKLESEEDLLKLDEAAKAAGVLSSIVRDAGQTQVVPGSRTVIAIGPAPKSVLEPLTGHFKLY
ncbi:peptidyl-tRNA hydrolase 2, mitochondrial-like [Atheta coriaria]|uniref:peptidyl-tRNA hydrolase 2, mitochondrial-like n=1 Tax=Dalotia coriaria TaxID=877792 RepID=UPI0031F3F214